MNEGRRRLLCKIETIIAKNGYNTNRNGGWYRYPVKYKEDGSNWIARGLSNPQTDSGISSMKYEIGANHIYIGRALDEVLDLLEDYLYKAKDEDDPFDEFGNYLDGDYDEDSDW
ncbi:MAG: hypothetical protein K6F91_01825 [Ruminococcus sp.]|nr:hypothetical protein [Ruminococcus sp.]